MSYGLSNPDLDFAIIVRVFPKWRSAYRATGTLWTPDEGARTRVGLMIHQRSKFTNIRCDLFRCRLQWKQNFQDGLSSEVHGYVKEHKPAQKWWVKGPTDLDFQVKPEDTDEWAIWLTMLLSNPDHYELRATWRNRN